MLTKSLRPDGSPYIDPIALEILDFDRERVDAELRRRGHNAISEPALAWSIRDPEGLRIEIAGRGWAEYVGRDCNGDAAQCAPDFRG